MAYLVAHVCFVALCRPRRFFCQGVALCRLCWFSRQVGFNPHGVLGRARLLCCIVPPDGGRAAKMASIRMAFLVVHVCCVDLRRLWWLSRQVGFNPHGVLGPARLLCCIVPPEGAVPPSWLKSALVVHVCDVELCRLWWLSHQAGFNPHGVLGRARLLCCIVPLVLVKPPAWLQSAWRYWSCTFAMLNCAAYGG